MPDPQEPRTGGGIRLVAARLNMWCSPHDPANATHLAFPLAEAEALEAVVAAAREAVINVEDGELFHLLQDALDHLDTLRNQP